MQATFMIVEGTLPVFLVDLDAWQRWHVPGGCMGGTAIAVKAAGGNIICPDPHPTDVEGQAVWNVSAAQLNMIPDLSPVALGPAPLYPGLAALPS